MKFIAGFIGKNKDFELIEIQQKLEEREKSITRKSRSRKRRRKKKHRRNTMNSPCLYCENRHFNCHSKCEKYIKYKSCYKSRDTEEQEYIGYINGAISRMKGKGRWT